MNASNGDTREYFTAAAEGRLVLQKCASCGAVQFPPRQHCATCWKAELSWVDSRGRGEIESITVVRRAPLPAFREKVPYVIVSVILEEGPRLITNLVGEDALDARIGDPVTVIFEAGDEGVLPQFRRR